MLPEAALAACLAATTPEALLKAPSDPELYDYAACSEVVTGTEGLCDGFDGGPASADRGVARHEVVAADGTVRLETTYGVCVSRAAAYRFIAGLVDGASDDALRPQMKLLLYGEDLPVDEVLRTYVDAYRSQSLENLPRPDLAKVGFFNHVLGPRACGAVKTRGLKRECYKKAATLSAYKAKNPSLCQADDVLCRALLQGPGVCKALGDRIVRRYCEKPTPKPVDLISPAKT